MSDLDRSPEPLESFPRQQARTQRFTLGRPRSFTVAEDGSRVVFLRTPAGGDPATSLWAFDVARARERLVVDARSLAGLHDEVLTEEEAARRERARESAGGIVAYATDRAARMATFAFGGRLWLADLNGERVRALEAASGPFDPRLDPSGRKIAYVAGRALRVVDTDGPDRLIVGEDDQHVSWGLAEFVAAEEMGRLRGFWWSPDGGSLAAARVDATHVPRWYLADPVEPSSEPRPVSYPAAGTRNADVSLAIFGLGGDRRDVEWDAERFPYLVRVGWSLVGGLTLLVQSRDQRRWQVLRADVETGRTEPVLEDADEAWLEIVAGVPAWTDDGSLVFVEKSEDAHRLTVGGVPVTPPRLQVRRVIGVVGQEVVVAASETDGPEESHLWSVGAGREVRRLTTRSGVHDGAVGGGVLVIVSASMDGAPRARVERGGEVVGTLGSFAEEPNITVSVSFATVGKRGLRTALLLPHRKTNGQLPVLLDPYGGPHLARVTRSRDAYLQSQWLADQGFGVIVADGRGTPGRGLAWEQSVLGDLATPALEDQVAALHGLAEDHPELDLDRVAIRGWSFGGYLSALAVLRCPELFRAAVVGAPVTEWRLYDTHYTERYLGTDVEAASYARSSIVDEARNLARPMLIIHGLADDNVYAAHSLRLSRALLEAGRPHAVLPIPGVTHMTPQEAVAENLLLLQVAFLKQALGMA